LNIHSIAGTPWRVNPCLISIFYESITNDNKCWYDVF
jgi:hypothetical protein